MENVVTFKDVLDCVNSENGNGRTNCSIGLFVNDYYEDKSVDVENLIVTKPRVVINSFTQDNEVYYDVAFKFKSCNDADYKQMWRFICKYAEKAKSENKRSENGEELEKVAVLSISVIPDKYNGKYFVNMTMPFIETFTHIENAYDGTASINFVCNDAGFQIMSSDDDMIDPRSIEQEIEQEILSEVN